MEEKKITKEQYDKAVKAVMEREIMDDHLDGMGKFLIPMVGMIFAGKIADVLFGENPDTSNGGGSEGMTVSFGKAIEALKDGKKVTRKGWNGKGMFLFLAHTTDITTEADLSCCSHLEGDLVLPSIVMKTADDHFIVGWLASQTDMLSEDWMIID